MLSRGRATGVSRARGAGARRPATASGTISTITATTIAAIPMAWFGGSPESRPTASHDRPHASAMPGATRQPLAHAMPRPITATTASTARPQADAASPQDSGTMPVSQAAVFATVASVTQPRWSPVTPSIRSASRKPARGVRVTTEMRNVMHSAISSRKMMTTVHSIVSSWAATSHSPLSTIVRAIHQPIARCRTEARWRGQRLPDRRRPTRPGVDHRPDAERRTSGCQIRPLGRQLTALRVLDLGATEAPDADEHRHEREPEGGDHRDLTCEVQTGGCRGIRVTRSRGFRHRSHATAPASRKGGVDTGSASSDRVDGIMAP